MRLGSKPDVREGEVDCWCRTSRSANASARSVDFTWVVQVESLTLNVVWSWARVQPNPAFCVSRLHDAFELQTIVLHGVARVGVKGMLCVTQRVLPSTCTAYCSFAHVILKLSKMILLRAVHMCQKIQEIVSSVRPVGGRQTFILSAPALDV